MPPTPRKAPAKRAPRKAAAKPAAPPAPVIPPGVLRLGQNPDPVETEPFFELDDVVWEIAKEPRPNLSLRFLRESQDPRIGFSTAQVNLLRAMVGPEAIAALEASDKVSKADIAALFDGLNKKLFGDPSEDPS